MDAQLLLMWASMKGYVGIVHIILKHGDDADAKTNVRNLLLLIIMIFMMMMIMMMTIIIVVTIVVIMIVTDDEDRDYSR